MARLDCLARRAFFLALMTAAWGGCGGKSSNGSTGTAGSGGTAAGDAGAGGSITIGSGGIAGGGAGTGGSAGGGAGTGGNGGNVGNVGSTGGGGDAGAGGSAGGAGGTGGAPCAQNGATCDFPDITCYYEMHQAGQQNNYYGCTCGRGDSGPARITCCFVGNAFNPNGILIPASQPDWWLTPSGSQWRCPPGS